MERVVRIVGLPDPAFIVWLGLQGAATFAVVPEVRAIWRSDLWLAAKVARTRAALDNVALHFGDDHADRTGARYLRSNG